MSYRTLAIEIGNDESEYTRTEPKSRGLSQGERGDWDWCDGGGFRNFQKQRTSALLKGFCDGSSIRSPSGGRPSVGSGWLKLMVLGVVYYFGIKQGVGSECLSEFLAAIRIDEQVGSSASALRTLKQQMKQAIIAYEEAQSSHRKPKAGTGICVGGDETFFGGLPILVMMELASGFILTEVACENRTYQTWSEQIAQWWSQTGWQCHFMVSDGAQALIKLAVTGLSCVSVADLFHGLRALAQPLGSAIGRSISQLQKQQAKLQLQVDKTTDESQRQALQKSLDTLDQQQQGLAQAQQTYQRALHTITQAVHPFQIDKLFHV